MPELKVIDLFPKKVSLHQSISAKIFAKNVHFENNYWCLTDDGVLTKGIL